MLAKTPLKDRLGAQNHFLLRCRKRNVQEDEDSQLKELNVRHITKTGALKFHKMESARKLLAAVRSQAPNSKLIAWVYVSSSSVPEAVYISSKSVRAKMIDEAKWLVNECGFDGVQWDYEFANNGNQDLCALLAETKAQLPANTMVSCATPMWYPFIP